MSDEPRRRDDDIEHDPTGLELATHIANMVANTSANVPAKQRRRKVPRPAAKRRGDPTPLGDAVDALIEHRGWAKEVSVKRLLAGWSGLVGQANADHCKPEAFVDKVLTVRADSTAWATSLRLLAPQLLAKLNAELGQGSIVRIEVLGPSAPSWKHGLRVVRDGRGPRDTYG